MQLGRAGATPLVGVFGSRVAPLALSALSALSGCAMTDVSVRTVETGRVERRVRRDPEAPIVSGVWHRDATGYAGPLEWQRCDIEARWTAVSVRVTRTTPRTDIGLPLVAAGAALALVGGSQSVDFEDEDCSPPPDPVCRQETDYHAGAMGAFVVGLGAFTAGAIMVLQKPALEAEPLSKTREVERTTESCIAPRDLRELSLAVRVAPREFVPVRLNEDGTSARIDVPDGLALAPGSELPIVVSRVPRAAASIMERGQPIGRVRFEAE